jgi:hypothetical protein
MPDGSCRPVVDRRCDLSAAPACSKARGLGGPDVPVPWRGGQARLVAVAETEQVQDRDAGAAGGGRRGRGGSVRGRERVVVLPHGRSEALAGLHRRRRERAGPLPNPEQRRIVAAPRDFWAVPATDLFDELETGEGGLTSEEADRRLAMEGLNTIEERSRNRPGCWPRSSRAPSCCCSSARPCCLWVWAL